MHKVAKLAAAALASVLTQGCVSDRHLGSTTQVGKVQGVYVEEYKGVFVEREVAGEKQGKPVWVYVTFAQPLDDGRTFATAMLVRVGGIERGDLVQLQLAPPGDFGTDTVSPHHEVTALVAKNTSMQALDFGRSGRQSMLEKLGQV